MTCCMSARRFFFADQRRSDFRNRLLKIELRRKLPRPQCLDGEKRLDGSGRAERVADGGLGGTDAGLTERVAKKVRVGLGLDAVVDRRRGPMGVDVADLRGRDPGLGRGGAHDLDQRRAVRLGLREMKEIGGVAVAGQVAKRRRPAPLRVLVRFENQKRGRLAEKQAGAIEIEGPAAVGARGLEAIEPDEDQFGQRLKTAGQHAVGRADGNQIGGMADGVGAAGAGVGDNDRVARKAERLLQVETCCCGR